MKIIKNFMEIEGLAVLMPTIFSDKRGTFVELYNKNIFSDTLSKKISFVQDNTSTSKKGVLRGIHLQKEPFAQGKLVRCERGEVFDVAVDLRPDSETFLHTAFINLSEDDNKLFWIPEGFGHGFLSLQDDTKVVYKTTNYYSKKDDITINFKEFEIPWPSIPGVSTFLLSDKDKNGLSLNEYKKINKRSKKQKF